MLDVFEHEGLGPFPREYTFDLKKQRALGLVFETVRSIETIFFRDSRNRERLTGKAPNQDVVIGNVPRSDAVNVAPWNLAEVLLVGDLGVPVPVRRENASAVFSLEGQPEAADPAEQIDELPFRQFR